MSMRKFIYAVLFLLATSAFSQQVVAQQVQVYWDSAGPLPNLYYFRTTGPNANTGVRTTYPMRNLSFGEPFPFAFVVRGNNLIIQYASGYTDVFRLDGYNSVLDIQFRTGLGQTALLGPGPWYGCRSGGMPVVIKVSICPVH
jgi:hypothetical protein